MTRATTQELVVATDMSSGQIVFHQRSGLEANTFSINIFQH